MLSFRRTARESEGQFGCEDAKGDRDIDFWLIYSENFDAC